MSLVSMTTTHDGLRQLERRWEATGEPWATVLLVHGLAEHSGRYEHVGAALAEAGLDVLAYDHRGFGRTEGRRAYVDRFDQLLDDLSLRMGDAEALGRPICLFGHSLGGLISLRYVLQRRDPRPVRLVLSAPAIEATVPTWQRIATPFLARRLPTLPFPSPVDLSQLSRDPTVGDAYAADPLVYRKVTPRFGDAVMEAMGEARRDLAELALPALVIHGGDDTLVPTRSSEPLGTLPDVKRKVYAGLRHETFNEPEGPEVIADMIEWLRDQLDGPQDAKRAESVEA